MLKLKDILMEERCNDTAGIVFTVKVPVAVFVQVFASVTTTVYTPADVPVVV